MSVRRQRGAGSGITEPGALSWLTAAGVAGLMLAPLAYLLLRAGTADQGVWGLILRRRTLALLANSLGLASVVTAASWLIAVPLAWLTTRSDLPGRRVWSVLLAVPLAVPSYLGAYTLIAALGPRGMLQRLLADPLGLGRLPDLYGFPGAALALTLFSYPYVYLTVRGALVRMDPALEEASRTLGFGGLATFFKVVLPNLRPAIAGGGLLVALYVLSDFGAVSFMQFDTFTRAIYLQYQAAFDRSYGAVLSLILVACTLIVLAGENWTRGRVRHDRVGPGAERPAGQVPLGGWRWPALLLCGAVVTLGVVLPVWVVVYWLLQSSEAAAGWRAVLPALVNSVGASAAAALATVVLALPVAYVSSRSRSLWARVVEGATYLGHGVPGMVVALSLVFFGVHVAYPLYQTPALLLYAYVVLFLPQAVGALRSSVLQINPHLEEAARTLGADAGRVLRSVSLPLLRPGALSAAAMVFLTTAKELPATLLLGPTGFRTLATTVWSATNEAFYGRAAPAALVLMMVSFVSVAFLLSESRRGLERKPAARSRGVWRLVRTGGRDRVVPGRVEAV